MKEIHATTLPIFKQTREHTNAKHKPKHKPVIAPSLMSKRPEQVERRSVLGANKLRPSRENQPPALSEIEQRNPNTVKREWEGKGETDLGEGGGGEKGGEGEEEGVGRGKADEGSEGSGEVGDEASHPPAAPPLPSFSRLKSRSWGARGHMSVLSNGPQRG